MEKEKQDFKNPEVTTYERDELIMDKVLTVISNSDPN